jgi:hypothetical protein
MQLVADKLGKSIAMSALVVKPGKLDDLIHHMKHDKGRERLLNGLPEGEVAELANINSV